MAFLKFKNVGLWYLLVVTVSASFSPTAADTCDVCYIDVPEVELHYWATSVVYNNAFAFWVTGIGFPDISLTSSPLPLTTCGPNTSVNYVTVFPSDINIANSNYDTVFGTITWEVYGNITTQGQTDIASGTAIISPTPYYDYSSVDIYNAGSVVTTSGTAFCQRTIESVEFSPSWIPETGTNNYATITSMGPLPLPTNLVQYLRANTELVSKYPQLTSCYADIIVRAIPVPNIPLSGTGGAIGPITITSHNSTYVTVCTSASITESSSGDFLNGPSTAPYSPYAIPSAAPSTTSSTPVNTGSGSGSGSGSGGSGSGSSGSGSGGSGSSGSGSSGSGSSDIGSGGTGSGGSGSSGSGSSGSGSSGSGSSGSGSSEGSSSGGGSGTSSSSQSSPAPTTSSPAGPGTSRIPGSTANQPSNPPASNTISGQTGSTESTTGMPTPSLGGIIASAGGFATPSPGSGSESIGTTPGQGGAPGGIGTGTLSYPGLVGTGNSMGTSPAQFTGGAWKNNGATSIIKFVVGIVVIVVI